MSSMSGAVNPASGSVFEALRKKRAQGELSNPVMENVERVNETTSTNNIVTQSAHIKSAHIRPAYGDTGGAFKRKQEMERGQHNPIVRSVNEEKATKRVVTVSTKDGIESCLIGELTTTPSTDVPAVALTLFKLYKNNPNVFSDYDFNGIPSADVIDYLTQLIEDLSNVS